MWGSNDSARLVDLPKWISDKESAHAAVREVQMSVESAISQANLCRIARSAARVLVQTLRTRAKTRRSAGIVRGRILHLENLK